MSVKLNYQLLNWVNNNVLIVLEIYYCDAINLHSMIEVFLVSLKIFTDKDWQEIGITGLPVMVNW